MLQFFVASQRLVVKSKKKLVLKQINKRFVDFLELFASFSCTRDRNRILNTAGSDRFWFRF
jgi:hypothetical protein